MRISDWSSDVCSSDLDELERVAGSCDWRRPRIPVVSNLTGAPVEAFDGAYWRAHAREPVRFAAGAEGFAGEIGKAFGRERVGRAGWDPVVAVSIQTKKRTS